MKVPIEKLSRLEVQAELSRIQRRSILTVVASLAVFVYSGFISPFLPSGPVIVPALGLYLSDLPELPLIAGVFYLIYLSVRSGRRRTALQSQLTRMAVADTSAGTATASVRSRPVSPASATDSISSGSEEISWFPNRVLQRVRTMSRMGAAVSVAGLSGILLLFVLGAAFGGAWRGWAFSWLATGVMFGVIMLGVGASSTRTEPRRIGVSQTGAYRDLPNAAKAQSLSFVPWTFVDSAQGQGSSGTRWVTLKTRDGKAVTFSTGAEGAEALLASFEAWKARSQETMTETLPTARGGVPSPATPPGAPSALPELPASAWHPNSLRRMWLGLGLFFLGLGLALTPLLGPYALRPRTFDAGVYLGLAYIIAVVVLFGARSMPKSVAIGPGGFLVRNGARNAGLRFEEVTSISAPGQALECTVRTGRTERFLSLGPREKREIQEAYRAFRDRSLSGKGSPPTELTQFVWTKNAARWAPAARFFVPFAIPLAVAAIGLPLFLSDPKAYFGFVLALPLAMLPTPFALFTIRAYRRAPSEVGLSDQGIAVRYPHHLYPAVALEKIMWAEIERVAGPHGQAFKGTLAEPSFGWASERYLTFRTRSGIIYTLGPVSPIIETAIVQHCRPNVTSADINVSER